jgi:uroporphyrinogen decarboxylase
MDSKELVSLALSFEKVPRVPYAIDFTVPAMRMLLSSNEGREFHGRLKNDLLLTPAIRVEWGVRDAHGLYTDEFGLTWDRSIDADIGMPRPVITPENFEGFAWPDPLLSSRFDTLQANIAGHPDRFQVMSLDFSLYERAWGLRGLENMYLDMVERPGFVEALLDRILEFNLKIMETALARFPQLDGVHFGDDFGDQNGVSMGPERWRAVMKPRLARQYGMAKAAGKKVSIHCCGSVEAILDDLVEIGVDLFNPFQPEVMEVEKVFRRYYGKLAFWGGISTQRLLPYASAAETTRAVERLLRMGRKGGYVIAPAHAAPGDGREENVHAMLRTILGQSA